MIGNVGKSKELYILFSIGCIAAIFFFALLPFPAMGEEENEGDESLEDLLGKEPDELQDIVVYVTTASRRPEKLWETAAAAYVISTTDILRSAATNVADLLRMVPGLFVGNLNSNHTIYGSRGFAYEMTNDVLVLIDGRQANFLGIGGLFWSIQDYPLEDIERIEVILGPGGTLWGTNSGNGVINIITKHTKDTQGGLITGIAGTDLYKGVVRYGGKLGEDADYRIYGLYKDVDDFNDAKGNDSVDDWSLSKGGFRIDWQPSEQDELTFQGDAYHDDAWIPKPFMFYPDGFYPSGRSRFEDDKTGLDLLAEWNRTFHDGSQMKWLTYYDYFEWDWDLITQINYHTFKTDFQYQFSLFDRHEFVVGAGYRLISDEAEKTLYFNFIPPSANNQTFTTFIQDHYTLIEEKLKLLLGIQLQYSDYSEFDYQPNAKLVYTPFESYTVWASVTRAAQHYYRGHEELIVPTGEIFHPLFTEPEPLVSYVNVGSADSQSILSFELGQRFQVTRDILFELSAFYSKIDDMYSLGFEDLENATLLNEPIPHYRIFQNPGNEVYGESFGGEVAMTARIADFWNMKASYSLLELHLYGPPNEHVFSNTDEMSPSQQIKVHSYIEFTRDVRLDLFYYFIDEISEGLYNTVVPAHSQLDVRLAWQPTEQLELSVVGTNLLDSQTFESIGFFMQPTEVERGVYAKLTYRF